MLRTIWQSRSLAKRVSRSVLVPVLILLLLAWFGLGFSLQVGFCWHEAEKAATHGGGLCTWLCAASGQDLSVRLSVWPAVQVQAGLSTDRVASDRRASFVGALESRGPPEAVLRATLSA